jgi:hypothetical protein
MMKKSIPIIIVSLAFFGTLAGCAPKSDEMKVGEIMPRGVFEATMRAGNVVCFDFDGNSCTSVGRVSAMTSDGFTWRSLSTNVGESWKIIVEASFVWEGDKSCVDKSQSVANAQNMMIVDKITDLHARIGPNEGTKNFEFTQKVINQFVADAEKSLSDTKKVCSAYRITKVNPIEAQVVEFVDGIEQIPQKPTTVTIWSAADSEKLLLRFERSSSF